MKITTEFTGQVGILPRVVKIECTNTFTEITTAGFLTGAQTEGYSFYPSDFFLIVYRNNVVGEFVIASIVDTIITLKQYIGEGSVLLPVIDGDFAVFNGTAGQIADRGYLPSDSTKNRVSMVSPSITSGQLAVFSDANGTITTNTSATPQLGSLGIGAIAPGFSGIAVGGRSAIGFSVTDSVSALFIGQGGSSANGIYLNPTLVIADASNRQSGINCGAFFLPDVGATIAESTGMYISPGVNVRNGTTITNVYGVHIGAGTFSSAGTGVVTNWTSLYVESPVNPGSGSRFAAALLGDIILGLDTSSRIYLRTNTYTGATAGSADPLPALPIGYISLAINGTFFKIAYYAA